MSRRPLGLAIRTITRRATAASSAVIMPATYVFPPPDPSCVPVQQKTKSKSGEGNLRCVFPVHRIYCVGRNYADHAIEMGGDPSRESPFFFSKPADAVVAAAATTAVSDYGDTAEETGTTRSCSADDDECCTIPYPIGTHEVHHEVELVVALGKGGVNISQEDAMEHVFGLGVGIDLTRRDLQTIAKERSRPWDCAKGFDNSAPVGSLLETKHLQLDKLGTKSIWLDVDGARRQSGTLNQMIWSIPEVISILSTQFALAPGDLIFTGTPSGVGPIERGQVVTAGVEGIGQLRFRLA
jgi:fumarylpyruvate hydrolase